MSFFKKEKGQPVQQGDPINDSHHIYREPPRALHAAAMASTADLRTDAIAQQRAKLSQSKAMFMTDISEILDAMDHPEDAQSILDVLAHSFAKEHLHEAMEAAIAIVEMTRPPQRSPSSIFQ